MRDVACVLWEAILKEVDLTAIHTVGGWAVSTVKVAYYGCYGRVVDPREKLVLFQI